MTDRKRFLIFLLIAFGGGWALMAAGMLLGGMWYQTCVAVAMLAPLLGVLLSHGGLKRARTDIGWLPEVAKRFRWYAAALWGPGALSLVCAGVFFLLFPGRFDPDFTYIRTQLTPDMDLPLVPQALIVAQFVQAVTYAPFINMILAVGEETGWRGYLTPWLTARLGRRLGVPLAGAVWGVWHWPLILCAGYEYGAGYPGAPFTGMLLMCVACAALGVLLTLLYERTDCIWAPALAHGALNAAAGIGILCMKPASSLFLGPSPLGLVSGLPLFLLAAAILLRRKNV